jgi:predicted O-linked N-acetylglucosamine transferase (SPINDLY family)
LPDDAIVLCNFNQSYKWSERFMRVWMRALQRAPRAVLWLLEPDAAARTNVMTMASEHNVAAQIHWAPRAKMEAHLARLAAANLALDQLPYASHTTGSDALWMGVPLLTCIGNTYQGRVGASLNNAVGLNELIVPNIEAYERMLGNLLVQPDRLRELQDDYAARAASAPLFDTATFTAQWEALLRSTYDARARSNTQRAIR